jgi:flavin reductase (DIM6/NTAB) family NADH-FMN oxidoreductase RutF
MPLEEFRSVPASTAYHLIHPKPAVIVISVDKSGMANGMTAAWTTPLSSSPPLIGVSISPRRYTYELVKSSGEFTINVLDRRYARQVHFVGTVSGRGRDKLAEAGFTLRKSKKVKPPHIGEALAVLECAVEKGVEAGDHVFFIGRVLEAYAKPDVFDGIYRPEKAKILMHLGEAYYATLADELIEL